VIVAHEALDLLVDGGEELPRDLAVEQKFAILRFSMRLLLCL
jgi:hypothetical protein